GALCFSPESILGLFLAARCHRRFAESHSVSSTRFWGNRPAIATGLVGSSRIFLRALFGARLWIDVCPGDTRVVRRAAGVEEILSCVPRSFHFCPERQRVAEFVR